MTGSIKELTDTLLTLPRKERADLAFRLLESLDRETEDAAETEEMDALWMNEVQRRVEEVESGRVDLIPGEEVMKEARYRLGC